MSKLTLNAAQTALLQQMYSDLEDAFYFGLEVDGDVPSLDLGASDSYDDDKAMGAVPGTSADDMRTLVKQQVIRTLAPVVARLTPAGITATVTLAKITGGGVNGSLTFTDGILTSKVDPT